MNEQRTYFAQIAYRYGGAWGTGETPQQALANARRSLGVTARELRRAPQYVLAFPAGTTVDVSDVSGGWTASSSPVAVVQAHHLTQAQREHLEGLCRPQTPEEAA